jgi:hypothetical protein
MANITQPKAEFRRGRFSSALLTHKHPAIGYEPADLFANDRSDNDTEELQTDLLGVQVELGRVDLGDLDCERDTSPEENHCVGYSRNGHAWFHHVAQGLEEVPECQRCRVDAAESE